MKLAKFTASAAALALMAGCGLGGPDYPSFSEASYRVEALTASPGSAQQVHTVIYRDGPKMRVESQLPGQAPSTIVFDQATNAAYVLHTATMAPAQPAATPSTSDNADAATPDMQAATPTQPTSPVQPVQTAPAQGTLGVAIRVADAEAPQPVETAWAALGEAGARHVGECEVAGESGEEWTPKDDNAGIERTACISDDGIVLRVREESQTLYEVTRLERGAQDPSLFGIPQGFAMVDPQAAVESVDETIGQLDSVESSNMASGQAPVATP